MSEDRTTRLKRLHMRSMRRGMKEMDIVLSRFWTEQGAALGPDELDLYEALLGENDQDIYKWVSGQNPPPPHFVPLILRLRK